MTTTRKTRPLQFRPFIPGLYITTRVLTSQCRGLYRKESSDGGEVSHDQERNRHLIKDFLSLMTRSVVDETSSYIISSTRAQSSSRHEQPPPRVGSRLFYSRLEKLELLGCYFHQTKNADNILGIKCVREETLTLGTE